MITVTETILNSGTPVRGAVVDIRLVTSLSDADAPGYGPGFTHADIGTAVTNASGVWSAQLEPNQTFGANTRYRLDYRYPGGGRTSVFIFVTPTPSTQEVASIKVGPPPPVPTWSPTTEEARLALAATPDALIFGDLSDRDDDGALLSAAVLWPDGTTGTYEALEISVAHPGAVDSYAVTYGTTTYTQPTMTRDADGAVVDRPEIEET